MAKPKFNPSEAAAKMFLSNTHDTPDAPDTQLAHNTHDTQEEKTQRKQKHPRINMAFYGDNLEYLKEAAWTERKSVTEYVNDLVAEDRKRKEGKNDD